MNNIIDWYLNYKKLSLDENVLLKERRSDHKIFCEDFSEIEDEYFKRMPFCNVCSDNRKIRVGESGTFFIDLLFSEHVNENTLIISTRSEHGSVKTHLDKYGKDTILLDVEDDIRKFNFDKLSIDTNKYQNIFVYIIGTTISGGQIIPQSYLVLLKQKLDKIGLPYKMVLDDVHGMFLVPRDYSIFDYVLYTAHAIVPSYEMGLLISKDGKYGDKILNWAKDYLPKLDLMLSKLSKEMLLKDVILEYMYDILKDTNVFTIHSHTSNHIFSVETKGIYFSENDIKELERYKFINFNKEKMLINTIWIRYQEFFDLDSEFAIAGLDKLKSILNRKLMIMEMR